jgi:hypothetical protein
MANEPEVKIKFDFETKNAQQKAEIIKQSISEIIADAKKKEQELSAFGGKAIEMSESVALMLERAKAAGKANVEETLATEFASTGLDKALSLGGKVEKYFTALEGLPRLLANVEADAESGALSLEEAYKKVERYKMLLSQLNVEDLSSETGLLNFDLENAAGLDEVLALWERLSTQADQSAADARKIEEAAKQKAQALLEEKNALDVNSEGYQKRANELLKSSMAYEEVGERAAAQATKFDLFKKKLTEALSNVDANEGTKKALDLLQEYQVTLGQQAEKTEKVSKQLETVDNERIERLRRADEAAERAEQNAQKRAEAEAKRIQKSEELAQREMFAMELVGQSRQQLIETIKRLTEEQKKASEAKDKVAFKQYTLQIAAARHQLERLRNTTNLSRIAFMQQAQTAQQLGQGFRTLVDTVTNFGKAAETGTLNLTGLTSTIMSLGYAVKAGLGPLGWAMTAVELLTSAWNMYAKEQQKVEEEEKKRKEAAAKLVTEYHNAANEVERLRDAEIDRSKIDTLTSGYRDLNTELKNRNDLLSSSLKMLNAEAALKAKEDEFENTVAKNDILVSYYTGKISEEQRDKLLDELDVKKAAQKGERAVAQATREAETKRKLEENMFQYMRTTGERKTALDLEGQRFMYSEADMQKRLTTYSQTESEYKKAKQREEEIKKEIDKLEKKYLRFDETRKVFLFDTSSLGLKGPSIARNYASLRKEIETLNVDYKKDAFLRAQENLLGWSPEDIESGQYARRKKTHDESVQVAQNALIEAQKEWQRAKAEKDAAEEKLSLAEATAKQDAKLAERTSEERTRLRNAKKEFEAAKKAEEAAARIRREAEEAAARAAEEKMKQAARNEKILAQAEWAVSESNPNRLTGEDSKNVRYLQNRLLPAATDGKLTQKQLETLQKKIDDAERSKTEVDDKLIKMIVSYLDASKINNKKLRDRVDAIQREL